MPNFALSVFLSEKTLKNNLSIIINNAIVKKIKPVKKSGCITRISGVKVKKEQNIDQMVSFWEKYVDEVSIKPATPRWDSYNNKPIKITKSCSQLWERMYVWYDGKINPCDFDYKSFLSVGNIKNNSLEEIWNSNEYNSLRKKHIEKKRSDCFPCDRCPL